MKKILLCGGGTAGHVIPHLALLPYLLPKYEVFYIGSVGGIEQSLLSDFPQVKYYQIPCTKLRRSLTLKNLAIPFKLANSVHQAKRLIRQIKPDLIFSKGGFVALPVLLGKGKTLAISHESDLSMGLANRLTKSKCATICTTFEETAQKYKHTLHTGSPIRSSLYHGDKTRFLRECGFSGEKEVLLVVGGSLGAKRLNELVIQAAPHLKEFDIVLLCGKNNISPVSLPHLRQFEFRKDMPDVLASADLVITRGGSNMLMELLALKKPALVVPLPRTESRGDQIDNAKYLSSQNLVNYIEENNLNKIELINQINTLKNNKKILQENIKKYKNIDGTKNIIQLIEKTLQ